MKNLRRFLSCLLAVTMLLALGITAYAAEFTDVPAGSDYAEAVQWASDNGYIYGYGDGRFGVNDHVTRAQLAAIFHRAAGTPAASGTSRFSDTAAGAYLHQCPQLGGECRPDCRIPGWAVWRGRSCYPPAGGHDPLALGRFSRRCR